MTADLSSPPASTVPVGEIRLMPRRVDHRDSTALLRAFHREQIDRYDFAESIDLTSTEYASPQGIFVVVYDGEQPVGCGGCRWHDRRTATVEIKKTYLLPALRGRGAGRLLLQWLEDQAIGWGAEQIILETGVRNTAALGLFVRSGYRPTSGYVPGRDPAINRAFVKSLAGPDPRLGEDARQAIVG
ncbi:GNAT family N-acetyltransferase [Actinoplanes sp. NPDC051470]|uniref:GNAT family N-acetyltransferase n=1 Tax=Actinoplanes sp. NPDC051470 TaxID=3157224 RepID=UPI00342B45DE